MRNSITHNTLYKVRFNALYTLLPAVAKTKLCTIHIVSVRFYWLPICRQQNLKVKQLNLV